MKITKAKCCTDLILAHTPGRFSRATVVFPVRYEWEDDTGPRDLVVPEGTRYNGVGPGNSAFIWLLEAIVPRWGEAVFAALPHDVAFETRFMYITDIKARRKYADMLFKALMISTGPNVLRGEGIVAYVSSVLHTAFWRLRVQVMYLAVRWFGAGTWNAHDEEFKR